MNDLWGWKSNGDITLNGRDVGRSKDQAQRLVDCANACAGMDDPAAEIVSLRDDLEYARQNFANASARAGEHLIEIAKLRAEVEKLNKRAEVDWDRNSALTAENKKLRAEVEQRKRLQPMMDGSPVSQGALNALVDQRDALRVDVEVWKRVASEQAKLHDKSASEVERLRGALMEIRTHARNCGFEWIDMRIVHDLARAALEGGE